MALLLTQRMYIFSVFHAFLPRKVEQWPCCWRSECIYLAFSLHGRAGFLGFGHRAKHAHFFGRNGLFGQLLVNRGGDPFMRSKVCIFSTVFAHVASETYIFSVFPSFLPRKVQQWNIYIYIYIYIYLVTSLLCGYCRVKARSNAKYIWKMFNKCIYLAFCLHFYRGKLNNGLAADAANVYI